MRINARRFASVLAPGVADLLAATLALVCLTGCANGAGQKDDPYAAEFAQAREQTDDPELLAMLADDKITDEEYSQVQQLTMACYAENGLKSWPRENGGMTIENTPHLPDDQFHDIESDCSWHYKGLIDPLHWDVRRNPGNEDRLSVILKCLKRFKIVDDGMTLDEFNALDLNNPPWDKLSGDAYGCETQMYDYNGGHPDLLPDEIRERDEL
jgi:hypothetical protein